jgi:hyperosmotically inducible periplasmic protein
MRQLNLFSALLAFSLAVPAFADDSSDPMITAKAKLDLWTTAGVPSTAVHVDTQDGVVTLYGKVSTEAQKALAQNTVASQNGVRSVKNLLQVVPETAEKTIAKSDADLKKAAENALKNDTALKDSKLEVKSVDHGLVLLGGEAATMADLVRAVDRLYGVPGIKRVATDAKAPDRLELGEDVGSKTAVAQKPGTHAKNDMSDTRITGEVKLKLWTASNLPSTDISVDTQQGHVNLFGSVPTAAAKASAGSLAAQVGGVTKVDNGLQIVPETAKKVVAAKDDAIAAELKNELSSRPELKDVKYDVKAGVVRLTGTVPSHWELLNAVRMVRFADGVKGVENQLQVSSRGQPASNY